MAYPPPEVLAAAKEAQLLALPDTALLQSRSLTSDSAGGFTEVWSAGTSVSCRLALVKGDEEEAHLVESTVQSAWITLPSTATVAEGYRATINAVVWEIVFVDPARAGRTAIRCLARRAK